MILFVARRQDHALEPSPRGGDCLFLDAADRQYQAAQADLAGHRGVALDGAAGQQRRQRGEHRDACRGPVLRDRARRHMDVDVAALEQFGIEAERLRPGLDQRHRRLGAFAHDLAELAGEDQRALARDARRLDEQDVAADWRPGEAGRDARHAGAHRHLVLEAARAQHLVEILGRDDDFRRGALGDLHRDAAQGGADLALELADAGLAGVVADDRMQCLVGEFGLLRREAVRR